MAIFALAGFMDKLYGQCTPNTINTPDRTICVGGNITISANNVPGSQTYLWEVSTDMGMTWSPAAGTNTSQSYVVNALYRNTPGVYKFHRVVTDTAPEACTNTSTTMTLTVVADLSSVTIGPAGPLTVCVGASVSLSISATTGGSGNWVYDWEQSNTGTGGWSNATGTQNAATYSVPTTTPVTRYYRQQLDDSGTGCDDNVVSNILQVIVVADPVAPVIARSPNVDEVCAGQTLTVTVTTPGSGGAGTTCEDEYRYSTDGGMTWSDWDTDPPSFPAEEGVNIVESRRNCDGSGCDNSGINSVSWVVNGNPECLVDGAMNVCANSAGHEYTGPAGMSNYAWSISGNGSINGAANQQMVTVDAGAPGAYTVTVTITDANGCTSSCSKTVTVDPLPVVTCPADQTICTELLPLTLTGGNPSGGTFSGPFVTGDQFNPPPIQSFFDIFYTVTDPGTGCQNTCTFRITVNPPPPVQCPPNLTICTELLPLTLTGGNPTGGTFSGPFVTGNQFNPPPQSVQSFFDIFYTVTDPGTGCQNTCTFQITVNPSPPVQCPPNQTICTELLPLTLTGGNPTGGTFSGTHVTGDQFNPPPPLIQSFFDIFYTVTDPGTGCQNTCTFRITVNPSPTPTITGGNLVCAGSMLQLTGTPGVVPPANLSLEAWVSSDDLVASVDNTGKVTGVAHGVVTITYTVTDGNGCSASTTTAVAVNQVPTVVIDPLGTYCVGVILTHQATLNPPAPASGDPYGYVWEACASNNCTNCNTSGFIPNNTAAAPTRPWNFADPNRSVKLTVSTPGCTATAMDCEDFSIVNDPVSPAIAKLPPDMTVCPDITLSVEVIAAGSGGTPDCVDQYRYSTNNGATWSVWSTVVPEFSSVKGTNIVQSRRYCGVFSGCDSIPNAVSWVVDDTEDPEISAPPSVEVQCSTALPDAATSVAELEDQGGSATDNCPGKLTVTHEDGDLTGDECDGTIERTYTVTDACGNMAVTTQIIAIQDMTDPTWNQPMPEDMAFECDETIPGPPALSSFTASDNCDTDVTVTYDGEATTPGPCINSYTINRTWTAVDDCGNATTHVQVITVQDTEAPVLVDPMVGCNSLNIAAVNECLNDALGFDPTTLEGAVAGLYTDNCSEGVSAAWINTEAGANNSDCSWTFTYFFEIEDACENSVICSVTRSGGDTEGPVLVGELPAGETNLNLCFEDIPAGPSTNDIAALFTDNCGEVNVEQSGTPTGDDCSWTVTYTYTVEDECGNTASSVSVTYSGGDTEAPQLTGTLPSDEMDLNLCFEDIPAGPTAAGIAALFTDNCGEVNVTKSGTSTGTDCSWTVTYTYTIEDDCGNETTSIEITYSGGDTEAPVLEGELPVGTTDLNLCFEDIPTGPSAAEIADLFTDNCGEVNVTKSGTPTGTDCSWTVTYTYTVEDDCGNSATSVIITYSGGDTEDPALINLQIDCSSLNKTGLNQCLSVAEDFDPTSLEDDIAALYQDNCAQAVTVTFLNATAGQGNGDCSWTFTYEYMIEDGCNNSLTCTVLYSGGDTEPPALVNAQITCASLNQNAVNECLSDASAFNAASLEASVAALYKDNCDASVTATLTGDEPGPNNSDCSWTFTYFYSIEDDCENSVTCSVTRSGGDTETPQLIDEDDCGSLNQTGLNQCLSAAEDFDPQDLEDDVATLYQDNCDNSVTAVWTGTTPGANNNDCAWSFTYTYAISDDCDNSVSCTVTYSGGDTQAPTWTTTPGSLDRTVECNDATSLATAQALFPEATDNCDQNVSNRIKTSGPFVAGSCPQAGTYTNTWTVTDDCGNTSSVFTQIITIVDTQAPTWASAAGSLDKTVECDDIGGLAGAQGLTPTANDNCDLSLTPVKTNGPFVAGPCPQAGTYTNTWVVTDDCGNTSTSVFTQVITVTDSKAPTWTTPATALDITLECSDGTGLAAAQSLFPVATDNCDMDVTNIVKVPGTPLQGPQNCPQSETITNTWTVVDDCGNTSPVYTQVITLLDRMAPNWTTAAGALDVTVECSDQMALTAAQAQTPAALDNCDQTLTPVKTAGAFVPGMTCPQEGSYTNTWTVTDDCGNTSSVFTQFITVTDDTPPTWSTSATALDVTLECSDATGLAAAQAAFPVAGDLCDQDVTNIVKTSGMFVPGTPPCVQAGTYTNTWTVTDDCGNTSSVFTQIITIIDNTPPTATAGQIAPCYPTEAEAEAAAIAATTSSDNCPGTLTTTASTSGDCSAVITVTVTDVCGNSATATYNTRIDNTPPTFTAPDDIMIFRDADCEYDASVEETGDVTNETDNCGGVVQATYEDEVDDTDPCNVVITRTWSLVDDCGNAASGQVQTITVKDNTPPIAVCQDITIELVALSLGSVPIPPLAVAGQSHDNCGPIEIEIVPLQLTCANLGLNTVNVTITDQCENTSTCTAQVTLTLPGGVPSLPTVNLTQSDNVICSGDKYTLDFGGANNPLGTEYMVTWTISPTFTNTMPSDNNVFLHGDFGAPTPPAIGEGMVTTSANMLMGMIENLNLNSVNITFTVTPKFAPCPGTPATITVTVRPLSKVTLIDPEPPAGICSGAQVGGFTIGHNLGNGTTDPSNSIVWSWSGDNLIASPPAGMDAGGGSPNALYIPATTLTNTGTTTTMAMLTITPQRTVDGETCPGMDTVVVIKVEPLPAIVCPGDITLATTDGGDCDTTLTLTHPDLNLNPDYCPATMTIAFSNGMPVPLSLPMGGAVSPGYSDNFTFSKGQTIVTYTVTDGNNNTATCSFAVTVTDNDPPVITCPPPITLDCSANLSPGPMAPAGTATATDNCPPTPMLSHSDEISSGTLCPQNNYVVFRTWTATDGAGNTVSCTQVITVTDAVPPTISCPANTTVDCTASTLPPATGTAGATDNCSTPEIGYNDGPTTPGDCPQEYTINRTWLARDACGNTASCLQTIFVQDITPPMLSCPPAVSVECSDELAPGAPGQGFPTGFPMVSDNCDMTPALTHADVKYTIPMACPQHYIIERTWTAVDDCGNSISCVQSITVDDTTDPEITAPAQDETVECDGAGNGAALMDWLASNGGAVAEDKCGDISWSNNFDGLSDDCGATGSATVTFTATDECGNSVQTTATFTIEDTIPPDISVEADDATVECDGSGNGAALMDWLASNGGAVASDACGSVSWTNDFSGLTDDCGATGIAEVTFIATDECGNSAQTTATFTIEDTTPPDISVEASDLAVDCDGQGNLDDLQAWLDDHGSAVATDACGDVEWTHNFDGLNAGCAATGGATVTFTATDECGNTAQTTATFSIIDTTPPDISVEASDETVECDGQGNGADLMNWLASNGGASASDDCGPVSWSNDFEELNDACGSTGSVTVTFTATDVCGNTAQTTATFTIEDTTPPVISEEATDKTVECDGQGNLAGLMDWLASNGGAVATDICSGVSWSNDFYGLSDDCGATGSATVIFTATDACGNTATTSATFSIEDTTDPVFTAFPTDAVVECDAVPPVGAPTATDNCDQDVTVTFDGEVRTNGNCPYKYTLARTWTAADDCGNTRVGTQLITVQDTQAPVLSGVPGDITAECSAVPTPASPTAIDNCDPMPVISFDQTSTQSTDINNCTYTNYTITRTWTAVDNCGNATTQTQIISVSDNTAPTIVCPPDITFLPCDASLNPAVNMTLGSALAMDNCDPNVLVSFADMKVVGQCPQDTIITRTWQAADNCQNAAACIQIITKRDVVPPAIVCPPNKTVECAQNQSFDPYQPNSTLGVATGTDNCDPGPLAIGYADAIVPTACDQEFTINRTWIATDACNNSTTCLQTVTVTDNTPPLIDCPDNVTVECDESTLPANTGTAIALDACDPTLATSHADQITPSTVCPQEYTITRNWISSDGCGNAVACTQTIVVDDSKAPTWTTATGTLDRTVECSDATGLAAAQSLFPVASDNCDNDVTNIVETSGIFVAGAVCPQEGTYTNTWTVTDACGNVSLTYTQVITITDNTPPAAAAPAAIDIECSTGLPAAATTITAFLALPGASASDLCSPTAELKVESTTTSLSGTQCTGVISRTYVITDQCGNSTAVTQTINVTDNTAPEITCPAPQTINCQDSQLPANTGSATATDNCSAAPAITYTDNLVPGSCPDAYTIERTWKATDDCGNTATCLQLISVQDLTPPVIACPADLAINCQDSSLPANTGTATATDNCDDVVAITSSDEIIPGNCPDTYTIERTWTATDDCNNSTTCVQTILVQDVQKPVMAFCPPNITINCEVDPTPANTGGPATATDNCDQSVTIESSDLVVPGNCPDRRQITRSWTATDNCGNSTSCVQVIDVQDMTAPTITYCPPDITLSCDVDPLVLTNTNGSAAATDNCDTNPTITFLDTFDPGTCFPAGVITRRWAAVDNCLNANSTACLQEITIIDNTAPVITCPDDVTIECDESLDPGENEDLGFATATDNCDPNRVITYADVRTDGPCLFEYTITRTWTATDACGNSASCEQTILIDDTTPPVITCPADQTVECGSDVSPAALGEPTATDNCGLAGISTPIDDVQPFGNCPQERRITRLWVAIDLCGNPAPCQQVITIEDTTPPVLTCIDVTVECNESTAPASAGVPAVTDNCDPEPSAPAFSDAIIPSQVCPQEYTITRSWSSTDACGNTGTCVQIITVDDSTDPVIACPANTTVECDESTEPADTGEATATDNCTLPQDIDIDYSDAKEDGDCPQAYTITRTWTATDACGNATECAQTITVEDTTPPTIADGCPLLNQYGSPMSNTATYVVGTSNGGPCPALAQVNLSVGTSYPAGYEIKVGNITVPGLSGCMEDNCADPDDVLARVEAITVSGNDCQKFFDIEFILVDPCGNESAESIHYIIEVLDDTAPLPPNPPAPAFYQCADQVPAPGPLTAADNCAGDITVTGVDTDNEGAGCANDPLIITRSWTFNDGCGNSVTIEQIITVADTEAPVFTACPPTATVQCGQDESPMATGVPVATDNCDDGVSFDYSDVEETTGLQCPVVKRITRTWTAFDDCGNQNASCVQTILVLDSAPPLIDCPDDLTLACNGDPSPANTGMAIALDACDPTPTITWDDEGSTGPCVNDTLATIIRTWFAFDECGNVAVCDQEISLIDELAPVITCPADTVINCEVLPAPANTGAATAKDNCDPEPVISIINDAAVPDPDCPQGRVITRTWQAADHCGNIASCEQIITVQDTTRPLLICPADITVQCDESTEPANTGIALAQDNCDPDPVMPPPVDMVTAGQCPVIKTIKRTWLAGDHCDNGALCMQLITVVDTEGPVLACPPNVTIECDEDPVLTGVATIEFDCDPEPSAPVFSDAIDEGDCPQEYTIIRTWTSTDACGNTGACAQTVTVDDSTDPVITCPPSVSVECDDSTEPAATGYATATDNCDMYVEVYSSDVSTQTNIGACSDYTYTITRTWTAVDACGNETACEQIISVADTEPPVITCPPTATINCEELGQIPAITGSPTVTDNCDPEPPFILLEMNGEPDPLCPQNATLTLVWKTVDYCNNMATCEQTVIMQDITPPVIACPAGAVVECNTSTEPAVTGTATATDNCDGDPAIGHSDAIDEGDCPQEYTITRTWTATDACGNNAQCEQSIEVVDDKAPLLSCPPTITVNCDDPSPAAAGFATADDNCDEDPDIDHSDVSTQTANGTCSDQSYAITRTWTAVDACGNQATPCTQTVIARDVTAPVITCPPPVNISCDDSLDPDENPNLGEATAVDNCDPEPGVTYTDAALPGTPVCPEIKVILRTWLTIDNCQNPAACSQRIAVVDLTAPELTCPDDFTVNCDDDYSVAVLGSATATDDCDPQPLVTYNGETSEPGDCPQEKTIFRAWTAVDDCGNSALCVQTIFVQDITPPTIVCPPAATVQCNENIDPQLNPNVGIPQVSDNCADDLVPGYLDTDLGLNGCTRTILRNWIVSDICNAAAACSQFIYLTDSQGPVLDCPADVTVECDESTDPFVNENLGAATATDNCDMEPAVDYSDETDEQDCGYIITRTWTAVDACGNSNSVECVQTITVTDTTPPAFTYCPDDITVDCGDELDPYENTELGVPTANDNCDDEPEFTYDDVTTIGNCLYLITRSWKAVDDCGNPSTASACVQIITLEDNAAPTIACPSPATVECTANLDPYQNTALGVASAQDDCAGLANLTYADGSSDPGQCPVTKVFTRTWTILDACGNSASCDQTITLEDHTPPVVNCPPADLTLDCSNPDNAMLIAAWLGSATATDACSFVSVVNNYSPTAFSDGCGATGMQTVSFQAFDECQNSSTACSRTISIFDNTPPAIVCPADLTLDCGNTQNGALIAAWLASATATDACGTPTVSNNYSPTAFSDGCGATGMQTVTFQAFDECQNSSTTCSRTISILDNTPPVVNCPPADLTLECGSTQNGALIAAWLASATATDACGTPTVSNNFSPNNFSDDCGFTGMQTVSFQAFDECQNSSATCSRKVSIVDTTPPTFTVPADLTLYQDENCTVNPAINLGDVTDESDNCSGGNLQATFTETVETGPGLTERTVYRAWKLTDDCGNMTVKTQAIAIRDTLEPTLHCPTGFQTGANTDTCTFVVLGQALDPGMIDDNCGVLDTTYALSGATTGSGSNTLVGVVFHPGATVVTWTVTDVNGNTATCSYPVFVADCIGITGRIIWEGNDFDTVGVAQVTVTLTGDDSTATGPTPPSGYYTLVPAMGSNFMITPTKPGPLTTITVDPMNGVTADDAQAILLHVFNTVPITDPYKLIAADVNMSNSVTRDDEVLIRRALLGSETALVYFQNKPWSFVPDTTDTPWSLGYHPPLNPFSAPIPSKRTLTGAGGGASNQNFYGIKTGDVNATANPLLKPAQLDPLYFRVQDRVLTAGEELTVTVRVANFADWAGFQLALQADPDALEIRGVETAWSPLGLTEADNFGLYDAKAGEIRSIWLDVSGRTLVDDAPVFALRFKALQSGVKLSEALRLKPKALEPLAFTAGQSRAPLLLVFAESQTTATANPAALNGGIELLQNRPNPFMDRTTIGFVLPQACEAQLRVLDVTGRELHRIDNTYPAGYNEETIRLRDIRATGVLYYELTTPFGKLSRKMTALAP